MDTESIPWILPGVAFPCRPRRGIWRLFAPVRREVFAARRVYSRKQGYEFRAAGRDRMTIIAPAYNALYDIVAEFIVSYDPQQITQDERDRQLEGIMAMARPAFWRR